MCTTYEFLYSSVPVNIVDDDVRFVLCIAVAEILGDLEIVHTPNFRA